MTERHGRSGWRGAALASAAFVVAACVAGPAPRDHFYRLVLPPASARLDRPALAGVLEVERLRADALTRERRLLHGDGASPELTPYDFQLWTESPTILVQQALAERLRAVGIADEVVTSELDVAEAWSLGGRIERLEHVVGAGEPRFEVALELALRRLDGPLLFRQSYRAQAPAPDGAAGAARAAGIALGEIADRFVADAVAAAAAAR